MNGASALGAAPDLARVLLFRLLDRLPPPEVASCLPCSSGPAASNIGRIAFSSRGPAVVAAICPTKPMPLATLYEHGRHALGNIVQPSFAG